MKSKKIALIGTHGTGKTTLAHELVVNLKKQGYDADFLGEIARKCPFPINEERTKKAQVWVILKQIIEELENEEKTEWLICDRGVLDSYCYYTTKFGRSETLEKLIKGHTKKYNLIIKIPIRNGFLKKDKIRSTDEEFQREIDNEINKILKRLKIRYIQFKEENLSNKQIIERILKEIKCQKNNSKEI